MTQVGAGKYTYEVIHDFCKLPAGETFGMVSRVAADDQDRVYVFQRKDPPVVVFDREGKYLGAWGSGEVTDPHGLKIIGDVASTPRIARTLSPNPSRSTANPSSSSARAASIPTPATSTPGWRNARRGRSTTPPR